MATSTLPLSSAIGANGDGLVWAAGEGRSEHEALAHLASLRSAIERLQRERAALFAELQRVCSSSARPA